MPKLGIHPLPKKRYHGGRWRIYWKWNSRQYSIPTAYIDRKNKMIVDADLRVISAALTMNEPNFPAPYMESDAVKRYLFDRYGNSVNDTIVHDADWLASYAITITGECSRGWAKHSLTHLKNLSRYCGGDIREVTASKAQEFLDSIIAKGKTQSTRNRTLASCSRFFKWVVRTNRSSANPFKGIKLLPEKRSGAIVYCTREERTEIINMAKESGWPDWLAVPIAFFTGMRREEICRLKWPDIRINEGLVFVSRTKTGKSRLIPLYNQLEELLLLIPIHERTGYVVKTPVDSGDEIKDEVKRPDRLINLVLHLRRGMERRLMIKWGHSLPILYAEKPRTKNLVEWKQLKDEHRKAKNEYNKILRSNRNQLNEQLERIGWNPFRHTFGSLLVQGGVSLDKVCAWMGNTPEVCRRHYAQFIPRDRR
ncbi:MAG: tyrosine-type recombinase/integrase, partial [Planctomycetota bacterium]|nr:tyrosine-type recombinase/integrase [Planctomycetota bacterium]